jgi:hypothetical protein
MVKVVPAAPLRQLQPVVHNNSMVHVMQKQSKNLQKVSSKPPVNNNLSVAERNKAARADAAALIAKFKPKRY